MFRATICLSIFSCVQAHACIEVEKFGQFHGEVEGRFVSRDYIDRPLFLLESPLIYEAPWGEKYSTVGNYVIDGASIPRVFWSFVGGPFSGNHLKASVVHDYFTDTCKHEPHREEGRECQSQLEVFEEDERVHGNYLLGMLAEGVPEDTACYEYLAVTFYKQWDLDDSGKPINIRIMETPIDDPDPNRLKKAWNIVKASVSAVIKTRKTTGGKVLNYFPDGQIPANEQGLEEYIDRLSEALRDDLYSDDPDVFGLLTDEAFESTEEIQPWPENFLEERYDPATDTFSNLTYFAPSVQTPSSPLADSLGISFTPPQVAPDPVVELFNYGNINLFDDEEVRQTMLEALAESEIVENLKQVPNYDVGDYLNIYPYSTDGTLMFEVTPKAVEELGNQGVEFEYGTRGHILGQSYLGGGWGGQVYSLPD